LYFKRLAENLEKFGISLGSVEMIPLMGYKEYLNTIYHCRFIISDSGTGQEEPALLNTPVIVPRDFSERPMSYLSNCSIKFTAGTPNTLEVCSWLDDIESGRIIMDKKWLGNGTTSQEVIDGLKQFFKI
jgi:UDP-N-acetylglucosamine 2-epimerase